MKQITVWERFSESHKVWEHNHIENGHTTSDTPKAHTKDQKCGWKGGTWKGTHAYLNDDNVVTYK